MSSIGERIHDSRMCIDNYLANFAHKFLFNQVKIICMCTFNFFSLSLRLAYIKQIKYIPTATPTVMMPTGFSQKLRPICTKTHDESAQCT